MNGTEDWPMSENEKRFRADSQAYYDAWMKESDSIGRLVHVSYLGFDGTVYGSYKQLYSKLPRFPRAGDLYTLEGRGYELQWFAKPCVFFTDVMFNPKLNKVEPVPIGFRVDPKARNMVLAL
jgi:hypothetical protein